MVTSIMLIAFPSVAILLLPTYAQIGYSAAFILLFLRLLQGFSIGGELPGLMIYFVELAPIKARGFYASLTGMVPAIGILFATAVIALLNVIFTTSQILSWAWRLPFLISVLLIIVGFYLRITLIETNVFSTIKEKLASPIKYVFQYEKINMLKILIYVISIAIPYYTFNVFLTVYLTSFLKISFDTAVQLSLFGVIAFMLLIPAFGLLVDKLGRKKQSILAGVALVIFIYPIYMLFNTKTMEFMLLGQFVFAALLASYIAVSPTFIAEQVSTKARYTALAIPQNLAFAIFGGTAPLVNIWLITKLHTTFAPSYFIAVAAILGIAISFTMKDKTNQAL